MSRAHGLAVVFAVLQFTFEPQDGLPAAVIDLLQGFFLLKIVQAHVYSFTRISELFIFLGHKSVTLRLNKKQHGGTKQERPSKILNPSNVKLQTRQCKLQFLVCGFPWKTRCSYN